MSLVDVFLDNKHFALVCGDTNLKKPDGSKSKIAKVLRSSNNIIFGFTGDVKNNVEFFSPFLTNGLKINEDVIRNFEYTDIINILNSKHGEYISNTMLSSNFDICSIIVGFDGLKFRGMRYCISSKDKSYKELGNQESGIEITHLGKEEHLNTFIELNEERLKELRKQNLEPSIEDLIHVFQETINIGSKFDETINNIMCHDIIYLE